MFCRERRERAMGDLSGDRNGSSPPERRDKTILDEDRELKREVDEALREWDRLVEGDRPASSAEPVRPGRA